MGPPIFIGGNPTGSSPSCTRHPGFNGAADFHRRKCRNAAEDAYWAKGFNGAADFHRRKYPRAVTQPRPSRRFNGAADFHRRKCSLPRGRADSHPRASMGPPIFIGGNFLLRLPEVGRITLLQWGRRFSSAEIHHALEHRHPHPSLQWGRRFSSAEIPGRLRVAPLGNRLQWGRRFSSAEMTTGTVWLYGDDTLQWGRRFSSAEMMVSNVAFHSRSFASMGPPIFIGGNQGNVDCVAR